VRDAGTARRCEPTGPHSTTGRHETDVRMTTAAGRHELAALNAQLSRGHRPDRPDPARVTAPAIN
jgi:hypothetical protein